MSQGLDLLTGAPLGASPSPEANRSGQIAASIYRELARLGPDEIPFDPDATGLSATASLDLRLDDQGMHYRDDQQRNYPTLDAMRTISRSSLAYSPNWSFRSGDPVGNLDEYAANTLRYNGPSNTAGGALVETSGTTNKIRNPRGEGDDAALPSEYVNVPNGTTVTVIGRGVENGWPYLEVRWSGTPTGDPALYFEGSTQVAASTGQAWALAFGLKIVGGDLSNLTNIQARMLMRDSGGAYLGIAHSGLFTPDATHRRYFTAGTATNGSLAYVQPAIYLDWDGSGDIDITLRIYLPQLEQAAAPTSPIMPPVDDPAESTRDAETVTEGVTFERPGRAYAMQWDGTSGGRVGPLKEFLQNTACQGEWGLWLTPFSVVNKIRNPRLVGHTNGVIGSGGALPTNFSLTAAGATVTVNGVSTVNGAPELDISIVGTLSGTLALYFEASTQIAVALNDAVNTSLNARLIGGSTANVSALRVNTYWHSAAGAYITQSSGQEMKTLLDRQARRFVNQDTVTNASWERARPAIYMTGTGAISIRLGLSLPQTTKTAFPCLPVLPEPGVVAESTQAAESCEISNGGWSNDNGPGTLFAEFVPLGGVAGTFGRVLAYGSGASDYSAISLDQATSAIRVVGVDGAVTQWGLAGPSWVAGSRYRAAFSFASNDIHSAVNAVAADDTSATIGFGTSKLRIGEQVGALYPSPVPLLFKSIRYFPAALPDAEVDALGAAS